MFIFQDPTEKTYACTSKDVGCTIYFRGISKDEREAFDKDAAKLRNKGKEKEYRKRLEHRMLALAIDTCTGWEGIVTQEKKPLEFRDDLKSGVLSHPEIRPLWMSYWTDYLFPGRDKNEDTEEEDDPDFFESK